MVGEAEGLSDPQKRHLAACGSRGSLEALEATASSVRTHLAGRVDAEPCSPQRACGSTDRLAAEGGLR